MKTKEKDYTLKEARSAVRWYKETYGIDHSGMLSFMVSGINLDDFVNKLYSGELGENPDSYLIKK